MKSKLVQVSLIVSALSAFSSTALAQGGVVGSIVGSVFDQTGGPIKGVKISARSETQIGGAKVAYTNDEGNFRIPGLQPGTFDVTAAAPKLKTIIQRAVKVGLNAASEVVLVMEVETTVEEVKVIEKAPIVSTTTANVKEVFDEEYIDNLPTEWKTSVEAFVNANTPGAAVDRGGLDRAKIRGGGRDQTAWLVEGFYVNNQKVTVKSLAAMEVQSAGYGAENASAPGGVVNMVSKSGSNKYELDVSAFIEHHTLRAFTDELDATSGYHNWFVNPSFGGPIIKDRLWFYLNSEVRNQVTARGGDVSGLNIFANSPPRAFASIRGSLKLTWQVTPRNKIQSRRQYFFIHSLREHRHTWSWLPRERVGPLGHP